MQPSPSETINSASRCAADSTAGTATAEFALLMRMAERFLARGLPFGIAAVQPDGLSLAACTQLKDVIAQTTEFLAWGRCGSICAVLFRENLLHETLPLCRRFLRGYHGVHAGIAFSSASVDASGVWLSARSALDEALTSGEPLVIRTAQPSAATGLSVEAGSSGRMPPEPDRPEAAWHANPNDAGNGHRRVAFPAAG